MAANEISALTIEETIKFEQNEKTEIDIYSTEKKMMMTTNGCSNSRLREKLEDLKRV